MSFIRLDWTDRDQWHAQVTHFFEQAMQGSLVNYRAGQERGAVIFQRDGQALKPVGPLAAQMVFDPDLIDHGLTRVSFWVEFV